MIPISARFSIAYMAALLGFLGAIYMLVPGASLVWDDHVFYDLAMTLEPSSSFAHSFNHSVFYPNYYRPLPFGVLLFSMNTLAGDATQMLHSLSLVLHLGNAVLIYLLCKASTARSQRIAAVVSVLYLSHPAMVQSAAWISALFDLSACFFILLALLCDLRFQRTKLRAFLVAMCFLLAALCKELAVVFPLLLVLLHLESKMEPSQIFARHKGTYIAVLLAGLLYLAIRYQALGYLYLTDASQDSMSALAALWQLGFYLSRISLPVFNSSPVHMAPGALSLTAPFVLGAMLFLLSIVGALVLKRHRGALAMVCILVTLAPVLGGHLGYGNFVADRYLTLTLAVSAILLARFAREWPRNFSGVVPASALLAGVLLTYIFFSRVSVDAWRSDLYLWSYANASYPENSRVQANLASVLLSAGDNKRALGLAKSAYKKDPGADNLLILIKAELKNGHLDAALQGIQHFHMQAGYTPNVHALVQLEVIAAVLDGDFQRVEIFVNADSADTHPAKSLHRALYFFALGESEKAKLELAVSPVAELEPYRIEIANILTANQSPLAQYFQ